MPRDSAAADRPASYLVGTAAAFPLFFRDRTKPINQLPFSPSAKFPKSGSSCESRVSPYFGPASLGPAGKKLVTNWIYRAQPVPYDWVPSDTPHSERAVVPPDLAAFRVPTER